MNGRSLIMRSFLLLALLLAGCGNDLEADLLTYEENTEQINNLNNEFNEIVNSMDLEKLQAIHYEEAEPDLAFLQNLSTQVDKNLVPVTDELLKELDSFEVTNTELEEVHGILRENIKVKRDFAEQISAFLNAYELSLDSNAQLITLSQSFITHQEDRDNIIESAETSEEIEEINTLIDVLNSNNEALDEHSTIFHSGDSADDKEEYANDELLPLIDEHIESMNELNLTTGKATRARTISLEMYYNYRTYFEERKNAMMSSEMLQEVPLQNILPLIETSRTLESQYDEEIENEKNEAR